MSTERTRGSGNWYVPVALVVFAILLACAWRWSALHEWTDIDRLVELMEPHRAHWTTPLVVIGVFVVAELLLFPVLVLVFVCGLVFGPWWGAVYALLGCVSSAILPFLIGRHLGREKLERWGGKLVRRMTSSLDRRGVVAVFLLRKIPAPFSLMNMVCGASGVTLRDFLIGTTLGMCTGIILITVVGSQLGAMLRDPDPARIAFGVLMLLFPIVLALLVQRWLNARMERSR
jgi:phospholipase D1/2